MKKSMKKLTLNRETLLSLEERKLQRVAGGDSIGLENPFEETGCHCYTFNCYPRTACLGTCSCSG